MRAHLASVVERLIGTVRREFLDHTLFWNAAISRESSSPFAPTTTVTACTPRSLVTVPMKWPEDRHQRS